MGGWPKAPNHSIFFDSAFRFTVGFGLAGGAVWKMWSTFGADHHDHEALIRTENAKELERLVRRHSSNVNLKTGQLHEQAESLKAAA